MRTFVAAALVAVASTKVLTQHDFDFINYIAEHGKSYADLEEYNLRFERFTAADQAIKELNREEITSVHGHNFLSDYTHEEYSRMLGLKNMARPERNPEAKTFVAAPESLSALPASVDWVTAGNYVNPVKD